MARQDASISSWNIPVSADTIQISKLILQDTLTSLIGGARVFAGIPMDKYLTGMYSSKSEKLPRFLLSEGRGPPSIVAQASASLMQNFPSYASSKNLNDLKREDISVTFVIAALFSFCDLLYGEKVDVSHQQFLNSLYLGLEVPLRLKKKRPDLEFSSCVSAGIVSVGSYLLKLNSQQLQAALDISLNSLSAEPSDQTADRIVGQLSRESLLVRDSVEAVMMSRHGLRWGTKASFLSVEDLRILIEGGETLMLTGIFFKPYVCHSSLLPSVATLEYLIAKYPDKFQLSQYFHPAPVSLVRITLNQEFFNIQNSLEKIPTTDQEEYTNLRFQVAYRLSGKNSADTEEFKSIYEKIQLSVDNSSNKISITVTFADNSSLSAEFRPDMLNFTEEKVSNKYFDYSPGIIGVDASRITDENIRNLGSQAGHVQSVFQYLYSRIPWD